MSNEVMKWSTVRVHGVLDDGVAMVWLVDRGRKNSEVERDAPAPRCSVNMMADLSSASVPTSPRSASVAASADTEDDSALLDALDGDDNDDSAALDDTRQERPLRDRMHRALSVFDSDDVVVDAIAELIDDAVVCSIEAFYERKLFKYAATWLGDRVFQALRVVSFTPLPRCELPSESIETTNDPVMAVVCPPHRERILREPLPCAVDPFSRHGIALRAPESPLSPSHLTHATMSTSRIRGGGHVGKDSPSRPSSHASFRMRKAAASLASSASPPVSPRSAGVAARAGFGLLRDANDAGQGHQHAPGVVYSTAPPPRISPRKAMLLLKNAHRVSAVGGPSAPAKRDHGEKTTGDIENRSDGSTADPDESDVKCDGASSAVAPSAGVRRRRASADNGVAARSSDDVSDDREQRGDDDGQDADENAMTSFFDTNKPIQVEFAIKRGGHQHSHHPRHSHSDPSGANHSSSSVFLPELSPQRRLSRSATPPATSVIGLNGSRALLEQMPHTDDNDRSDDHCIDDASNLHSQLQTMVLAPGVKLQCDEGTKTGPELPLFPTRMRKATFYVRCGTPTQQRCERQSHVMRLTNEWMWL